MADDIDSGEGVQQGSGVNCQQQKLDILVQVCFAEDICNHSTGIVL